MVSTKDTSAVQLMVVEAAPVTVMRMAPTLEFSAVIETSHAVAPALSMSAVGDRTDPMIAVLAMVPSRLMSTRRMYAAWSVPLADLATTRMSAKTAWLLARMK